MRALFIKITVIAVLVLGSYRIALWIARMTNAFESMSEFVRLWLMVGIAVYLMYLLGTGLIQWLKKR